ncbi:hypothetical protein [Bdellovibrio reynosensis]|uniref:Uncharacterized protein n=1 Tax=Bdellovibrio reynosensis TaxID=2835041 RepID=A0ABY4CFY3_9BACT|nr:hypothetical protein [Bdellovibrio reynosensis]UOF02458.1 hypothetical protein MNR06_05780 [Bdellovibrio reynosensis]
MKTFIFAIACFVLTSEAQAVETFHLRCRGGGNHEFQLYAQEYGNWLTMHFKRSKTTYIAPGECSWDDRPVRTDEPSRVCQHSSYPTGKFNISFFARYNQPAVLLPVTENVKWIRKMGYDYAYQSFYVANNPALQCLDIHAFD